MAAAATALGRAATGAIALIPRLEEAVTRTEVLLDRGDAAVTIIRAGGGRRGRDGARRQSGWTLTEAARVLRKAGAGPVLPLVLALDG